MTILLTSQQILNRFKKFPRMGCVAVDGDVTEGCFDDVQIYFSVRCDVLLNCGAVDGRVNLEVSDATFPVLRQGTEVHGGYHVVRPRRGAPGRQSHVAGVDGERRIYAAFAREKEIISWRRAKKAQLIESNNPKWLDLSAERGEGEIPRSARNDTQD